MKDGIKAQIMRDEIKAQTCFNIITNHINCHRITSPNIIKTYQTLLEIKSTYEPLDPKVFLEHFSLQSAFEPVTSPKKKHSLKFFNGQNEIRAKKQQKIHQKIHQNTLKYTRKYIKIHQKIHQKLRQNTLKDTPKNIPKNTIKA